VTRDPDFPFFAFQLVRYLLGWTILGFAGHGETLHWTHVVGAVVFLLLSRPLALVIRNMADDPWRRR
jgi:hypothetical protein